MKSVIVTFKYTFLPAKKKPHKKGGLAKLLFLLVVFNRSVSEHSKRVFPSNTNVRTVNSLSWAYINQVHPSHFQKFQVKYEDLIFYDFINTGFPGWSLYHRAAMTMETLTSFYNSDSRDIGIEHTPSVWLEAKNIERRIEANFQHKLADDARRF